MARRKHHKVNQFPPVLIEAINQRIVGGETYESIAKWLSEEHQKAIGKSSLQRYGKDFVAKLERLKVIKEQAKVICQAAPDAPATEMHEAANQLAVQLIMETLMKVPDLEGAKVTELFKALSLLERSAVAREKLKYEFDKGVEAGLARLKEELKAELNSDPVLLQRLYEMADQVREKVVS